MITSMDRVARLISEAVRRLELDLRGMTVYTEVGTGAYAATPVIALAAGAAAVCAVVKDSRYGPAEQAQVELERLLRVIGVSSSPLLVSEKSEKDLRAADIITNLGHVRPIDRQTVRWMDAGRAVVPYMCEAWEVRPGDVDIEACTEFGIPVMGTNEEHWASSVFHYVGMLAVKLLLEAHIEVEGSRILVLGSDKFGAVIERTLRSCRSYVRLCPDVKALVDTVTREGADAILCAEYTDGRTLIGPGALLEAEALAALAPGVTVVLLAGDCDVDALEAYGIPVYPAERQGPHRMSRTLAHLGAKPVIDLLAAGLKVGELMRRARNVCQDVRCIEAMVAADPKFGGLGQVIRPEKLAAEASTP
jgi:hypothetical protein